MTKESNTIEPEVLRGLALDLLSKGREVQLPLGGSSMWPWMRSGDLGQIKPLVAGEHPVPGEVVVFGSVDKLVAHRVVRCLKTKEGLWYVTKGDACLRPDPPRQLGSLLGKVTAIHRGEGKCFDPFSPLLAKISYLTVPLYFVLSTCRRVIRKGHSILKIK